MVTWMRSSMTVMESVIGSPVCLSTLNLLTRFRAMVASFSLTLSVSEIFAMSLKKAWESFERSKVNAYDMGSSHFFFMPFLKEAAF